MVPDKNPNKDENDAKETKYAICKLCKEKQKLLFWEVFGNVPRTTAVNRYRVIPEMQRPRMYVDFGVCPATNEKGEKCLSDLVKVQPQHENYFKVACQYGKCTYGKGKAKDDRNIL